MNIFRVFEAHKNPFEKFIDWLDGREKKKVSGLPERLLMLSGKTIAYILPFTFFVERMVNRVLNRLKNGDTLQPLGRRNKELSVVIVNWNGEALLPPCLTHLEKALKSLTGDHEVIVVDNGSKDRSVEIVMRDFPWAKVIPLRKNLGFSRGNNEGVKVATKDLVMLMNNDIFIPEKTFDYLLSHFDDEKVFAVAPKVVLEDDTLNEGHSWGEFSDGILRFYNERQFKGNDRVEKPSLTLYPIGACAVMDRRCYWEMGGLDTMFSPFYWEDDDLGYRALKRGYKVIYDPRLTVIHKNAASSSRLSKTYINVIREKNMILFFWKNLTHLSYVKEYLRTFRQGINIMIQRKNYPGLIAYLLAFMQIGEVLRGRWKEASQIRFSDKDVLSMTRKERTKTSTIHHRPKILLITPFLPFPLNNGGAIRIYNMTKRLKDRYDFSLLSFVDSQIQAQYVNDLSGIFKDVYLVERKPTPANGLMKSELPEGYAHYISIKMIKSIGDILAQNGIDIVQIEFPWMAYYGSLVHNQPSIFVEHDIGSMFYGRSFTRPAKGVERIFSPLKALNYESAFIECYDRVIAVTDKDRRVLETLFPFASVSTVETGVDLESFPYLYRNDGEKNIIYLGSYRHYPNEDAVVYFVNEIFPLIKREDRDVRLTIVGSHPTRRINRLKGREDIVVTGSVPDVKEYLKKGTVFIAPVRLGGGIKGKILESMAVGVPVVATPLAAVGMGARNGDEILLAHKPDDFAEKVLHLFSDESLRERLSKNARRLVEERFDWGVLSVKMGNVYEELLRGTNGRV